MKRSRIINRKIALLKIPLRTAKAIHITSLKAKLEKRKDALSQKSSVLMVAGLLGDCGISSTQPQVMPSLPILVNLFTRDRN